MGQSLSWVAIRGRPEPDLHRLLGLKKTGRRGHYGEHPVVGVALDSGWYLLIANGSDDPIARTKVLTLLSKGGEAVTCSIEEHVMFSSCARWKNGRKLWSVKHRGEEGPFDLVKTGRPPASCAALERELRAAQKAEGGDDAGVDHLFDLPLRLGQELVGFRHDEAGGAAPGGEFETLKLGLRQRAGRVLGASLPWLYVAGVLIVVIVIVIVAGNLAHRLIGWLLELLKVLVS